MQIMTKITVPQLLWWHRKNKISKINMKTSRHMDILWQKP